MERRRSLREIVELLEKKDPKVGEIKVFLGKMGVLNTSVDPTPSPGPPAYDPEKKVIELGYVSAGLHNLRKETAPLVALTLLHEAMHAAGFGELPAWYLNLYWAKKLLGNRGVVRLMKNYGLYPRPLDRLRSEMKRRLFLMKMHGVSGRRLEVEERSETDLRVVRWLMKRGIPPRRDVVSKWEGGEVLTLSDVLKVLRSLSVQKKRPLGGDKASG